MPLADTPAADTPSPEVVQLDIEVGPGSLNLPDPRLGLADLASYKSKLTASFEGTQAGQAVKWTQTFLFLQTKDPAARQLTVENTGAALELLPGFTAEIGGAAYQRLGDGTACVASRLDVDNSLLQEFEPAAQLPGLWGADEAGKEVVNGVESAHYTFDERALGEEGLNESVGELWLASADGPVLRYRRTTTADASYFGNDTQGTLAWEYELTETDGTFSIDLPEDCPPGLVDAPRLPDAVNVNSLPGLLRYETASSVAQARDFYLQELPKLGWELPPQMQLPPGMTGEEYQKALEVLKSLGGPVEPTPTEDPSKAFEVFRQGGQSLSVIITGGGPRTHVLIVLGKEVP